MRGRPAGREVRDRREPGPFGQLTFAVLAAVTGLTAIVPASVVVAPAVTGQAAAPRPTSTAETLLRLADGPRVMPPLLLQPPQLAAPVLPPAPGLALVPELPGVPDVPMVTTTALPGTAAAAAIAFGLAQRGLPYVWGGNGPLEGDPGFDCSGLTKAAYAFAGIVLPRTAHTQFYAGPHVPAGAPLLPGDLVFYGVPERVHHVGIYLGAGRMLNAPDFGKPVQVAWVRWPGDDYIGATRPAAGRDAPGLLLEPDLPRKVPPEPAPQAPPGPTRFPAPAAPDPPAPAPAPATTTAPDRITPAAPEPRPGGSATAPPHGVPTGEQGAGTESTLAAPAQPSPAQPSPAQPSALAGASPPANGPATAVAPSGAPEPAGAAAPTGSTASTPGTGSTPAAAPTQSAAPVTPPRSSATPTPSTVDKTSPTTMAAPPPPSSAKGSSAPPRTSTPAAAAPPSGPPSSAAPRTTTGPTRTTPPTTSPAPASSDAVAAQGDRLTLPGEHHLRLVPARPGRNGLPTAPSEPGTAGVTDGRALALSPDVPTDELVPGATLLLEGTGEPRELTVTSRRAVDAKTAAGIATASVDRLVLLRVRQDGSVLVVVAE